MPDTNRFTEQAKKTPRSEGPARKSEKVEGRGPVSGREEEEEEGARKAAQGMHEPDNDGSLVPRRHSHFLFFHAQDVPALFHQYFERHLMIVHIWIIHLPR